VCERETKNFTANGQHHSKYNPVRLTSLFRNKIPCDSPVSFEIKSRVTHQSLFEMWIECNAVNTPSLIPIQLTWKERKTGLSYFH
jgi:hypothetical protein